MEGDPILWEWASFAARWLHVVAAMAWIGSSFYFIALDLGLKSHDRLPEGLKMKQSKILLNLALLRPTSNVCS